jgi:hypothetical protein
LDLITNNEEGITNMLIDLQQRDAETHKWEQVATFRYAHMAIEAAIAFSKLDKGTYRTLDHRWVDDGIEVTTIINGNVITA